MCAQVLWFTRQKRCCRLGSTGILFPDLRASRVEQELEPLKVKWDAQEAAAVAAQNARAGTVVNLS